MGGEVDIKSHERSKTRTIRPEVGVGCLSVMSKHGSVKKMCKRRTWIT